jgi:hypothetical protein
MASPRLIEKEKKENKKEITRMVPAKRDVAWLRIVALRFE